MKLMKKTIALLMIVLVAACNDSPDVPPDNTPNLRAMSAEEIQVSHGTNDFAFNLFRNIDGTPTENSFISPLSVSIALGMVMNGASDETKQSILNTIDYSGFTAAEVNQAYHDLTELLLSMDRTVTLSIANSVWYNSDYNVKPDFASVIQQQYDGKIEGLNFKSGETIKTINKWVSDKTNQKITDILKQIYPQEVMYLINTIYFNGKWTFKFNKAKTHDAPFKTIDGITKTVDMMMAPEATIGFFQNDVVQVIDIPYGNKQFNFTIVAPFSDFNGVVSNLNAAQLTDWLSQSRNTQLTLEIPRFKMTWRQDLKQTLSDMGMKMADFPNLFDNFSRDLEITRVVHQTYLDVNEDGVEAAAATKVGIGVTSAPPPSRLTIDRPFLFMIREKHSGVILFMGKLVNPANL